MEVFECDICFEIRDIQIELQCSHSLCKQCLKRLKKPKLCPFCRQPVCTPLQFEEPIVDRELRERLKITDDVIAWNLSRLERLLPPKKRLQREKNANKYDKKNINKDKIEHKRNIENVRKKVKKKRNYNRRKKYRSLSF